MSNTPLTEARDLLQNLRDTTAKHNKMDTPQAAQQYKVILDSAAPAIEAVATLALAEEQRIANKLKLIEISNQRGVSLPEGVWDQVEAFLAD